MFCFTGIHVFFLLFELIYVNFQIIKMECQVKKNEHFRHLFLLAFNQGFKVEKASRDIRAVYGEGAMVEGILMVV